MGATLPPKVGRGEGAAEDGGAAEDEHLADADLATRRVVEGERVVDDVIRAQRAHHMDAGREEEEAETQENVAKTPKKASRARARKRGAPSAGNS